MVNVSISRALTVAALLSASLTACSDQPVAPPTGGPERPVPLPLGVYQVIITGADGSGNGAAASVQPVAPGDGPSQALNPQASGIVLEAVSTTTFTEGSRTTGGQRFVMATFRVRNATGAPVTNLTMIPAIRTGTIANSPFSSLLVFSGAAAPPAVATQLVPAGAVTLGEDGLIRSTYPDVLQVFLESEVAAIPLPAGTTSLMPYGFVVRNPTDPNSRTLPAATSDNDWRGLVTFAFRYPLQSSAAGDPFSIGLQFMAVQDTETRITESMEEAGDTAATRRLTARATALGVTTTTVLNGSPAAAPFVADFPGQRQICGARTAGTAASPVNTITAPGAYSRLEVYRPGEVLDACGGSFRTGSPAFAHYGMPYQVTVRAMDRYGNVRSLPDTVTLRSTDGTATMPVAGGLVGGAAGLTATYVTYGNSTLTATGRRLVSQVPVTVWGMTRLWTGDAGTDWLVNGDWSLNMHPGVQDSVTIPGDRPAYPLLVQNHTTAALTMTPGATVQPTLNLGGYDLTVNGSVNLGTSGTMTGAGRLILAGTAATVGGGVSNFDVRNMRVLGSYTTSSNVTVSGGRIVVQGGRLRNYANRVRVRP